MVNIYRFLCCVLLVEKLCVGQLTETQKVRNMSIAGY